MKTFATISTCLLVLVGAINVAVDPYGLFHLTELSGLNKQRPEVGKHVRLVKAHRVRLIKPKGVILGSSRAEYGFDPEHPGWDLGAHPVYNLALPSASIYEVFRYLQHAHALSGVKEAVLALDLFMFNTTRIVEAGFSEDRLAWSGDAVSPAGWVRDLVTALFSFDALFASFRTIRYQGTSAHVSYLHNGARHPTSNWWKIQKAGGHRNAFLSNERYSLTAPDGWGLFRLTSDGRHTLPTMETLRELIAFCYSQEIDLHLLIAPIHARKLEVLWHYGLWPTYELWKQSLTDIVASVTPPHSRSEPFALWDFSGYNSITTESVPPIGDSTTQMQWFWEGSHYRKETGDLVLDKVFGYHTADRMPPEDFGTRLTLSNIDTHLESTRQAREIYARTHKEDVEEIQRLIRDTARNRQKLVQIMALR